MEWHIKFDTYGMNVTCLTRKKYALQFYDWPPKSCDDSQHKTKAHKPIYLKCGRLLSCASACKPIDRTRDPNLLSDDEVFLDSSASTVTSSMTSPVPRQVVVRGTQHAVVQRVAGRGESVNCDMVLVCRIRAFAI